jgi:hypothetical protein
MSKSAATRKYRNQFDPSPYLKLLDATPIPDGVGMCRLTDGRIVTFYPGKPGKVAVFAQSTSEDRTIQRTFGVKEHDAIREWVLSGGSIEAEEQAKRIRAHAFLLYEALKTICELRTAAECEDVARTVLAKVDGDES